jgi:hypothetical protein
LTESQGDVQKLEKDPEESYNSVLERRVSMAFDRKSLSEKIIQKIEED